MGLPTSAEMQLLQTAQPRWYPPPAAVRRAEAPLRGVTTRFRFIPEPDDRILRMTRHVALIERRCIADGTGFARASQAQSCALIALHLAPLRLAFSGRAVEVVTPNHLSLHAPGSIHAREMISAQGELSECIALSPTLLRQVSATHGLGGNEPEAALFANAFAPCNAAAFIAHRRLFALARARSSALDSRAIERMVTVIALEGLRGARQRAVVEQKERSARRRPDCRRRRERVEAAKILLASEFLAEEPVSGLASRLRCSEGHLSRAFHALTGYRLVEYRTELRLRRGLVEIEKTGSDLADVALQLGFVSHSHFSSTMRQRFGFTPTDYLRSLR